jgi:hypothetical protein
MLKVVGIILLIGALIAVTPIIIVGVTASNSCSEGWQKRAYTTSLANGVDQLKDFDSVVFTQQSNAAIQTRNTLNESSDCFTSNRDPIAYKDITVASSAPDLIREIDTNLATFGYMSSLNWQYYLFRECGLSYASKTFSYGDRYITVKLGTSPASCNYSGGDIAGDAAKEEFMQLTVTNINAQMRLVGTAVR